MAGSLTQLALEGGCAISENGATALAALTGLRALSLGFRCAGACAAAAAVQGMMMMRCMMMMMMMMMRCMPRSQRRKCRVIHRSCPPVPALDAATT